MNQTRNSLIKIANAAINLLFPINCLDCGHEGDWLCENCFTRLEFKNQQTCLNCQQPTKGNFCTLCSSDFALSGILIAADYNNKIIANLIKQLKYHFSQDIAEILSEFLVNFLNYKINFNLEKFELAPVPLHRKRFNWRGFNQAEEIAKFIGSKLDLPLTKELVRIRNTKPQVKLTAAERKVNVQDCFHWTGNSLGGKNFLLVDDVTTTGSTLNECAKALKSAGANEVWGLVVANG